MFDRLRQLKRDERGQVLLFFVFMSPVLIMLAVASYNIGTSVGEKISIQDAADAAAYSGATWRARQFNFIAYTNRAMAADYGVIGMIVALKSNARMVETVTDALEVLSWFGGPITALLGKILEEGGDYYDMVTDYLAMSIPWFRGLAGFTSHAQVTFVRAVDVFLLPFGGEYIPSVLPKVLETIDPAMEAEMIVGVFEGWRGYKALTRVETEREETQLMSVSKEQLGTFYRGFSNFFYEKDLSYVASPEHDIHASDHIRIGLFWYSEDASAREFDYPGLWDATGFKFYPYMDFNPRLKARIQQRGLFPSYHALISKEQSDVSFVEAFTLDADEALLDEKFWSFSRAEVVYLPMSDEKPNLFNPYWYPRLAPVKRMFTEGGEIPGALSKISDYMLTH